MRAHSARIGTTENQMTNYFYRPIPHYNGAILKCAGIANETNRTWFMANNPEAIELDSYRGDRIRAFDYSEVKEGSM